MWNLWRLLGAQKGIFSYLCAYVIVLLQLFQESRAKKYNSALSLFSVGCYTKVCRSSPPLSWSVCESECEYIATSFSRATRNSHIRWVCLCVAKPVKFGDTQARSDFFWPISRPNLIGGLRSIFNSLYHQCHSSSAPLCPFHLAHSTVGWQSFEKPLSVFFLANGETLEESAFSSLWVWNPPCSCPSTRLFSFCFSWYVCRWLASSVAWETWVLAH